MANPDRMHRLTIEVFNRIWDVAEIYNIRDIYEELIDRLIIRLAQEITESEIKEIFKETFESVR